jgi:hypothetical protein
MTILLWTLGVALVFVGFAGILLPAVPGHILIFAGLALGAWADGFVRVGIWTVVIIGAIALASYFVDLVATALGVKYLGASRRAMAGAAIGTILGLFLGLPGIVLGPFVGAVIGELSARPDLARAGRAGLAAWVGFALGTAAKVALAFLMLAVFLAALVF